MGMGSVEWQNWKFQKTSHNTRHITQNPFQNHLCCVPCSHPLQKTSTRSQTKTNSPEAFAFTFNQRKRKKTSQERKLRNWVTEGGERGRATGLGLSVDSGE